MSHKLLSLKLCCQSGVGKCLSCQPHLTFNVMWWPEDISDNVHGTRRRAMLDVLSSVGGRPRTSFFQCCCVVEFFNVVVFVDCFNVLWIFSMLMFFSMLLCCGLYMHALLDPMSLDKLLC